MQKMDASMRCLGLTFFLLIWLGLVLPPSPILAAGIDGGKSAARHQSSRCFQFPALKHMIYARLRFAGNKVTGAYLFDYDYAGDDFRTYPFKGVVAGKRIKVTFARQNPYEISLGWDLAGGEKNRHATLKIVDQLLVHASRFATYKREVKSGNSSLYYMAAISCTKVPRR